MAKNPAAVALGRKGGKAYVKNSTPEQRSESARKAVVARWAKARKSLTEIEKRQPKINKLLKKAKDQK